MDMQSTDLAVSHVERLASTTIGDPALPHVVLVHGFTQNSISWRWVASQLESSFLVTSVDLPGHGDSSEVRAADLDHASELLANTTEHATYVGYSLGGRVCLNLAVKHPELVDALVLVSTSPGIESYEEREQRRRSDDALADRLDPPDPSVTPIKLVDFLHDWVSQSLFAHLDATVSDLNSRLTNTPEGLAHSLRTVGAGRMQPLYQELSKLEMPVLYLAGIVDTKYTRLAERAAELTGENATLVIVEDSGHAVHFEHHEKFYELLRAFLDPVTG